MMAVVWGRGSARPRPRLEGSVDGGWDPRPPGPTPLLPSLAGPLAHQGGGGPTPSVGWGGWAGVINFPPPGPRGWMLSHLKTENKLSILF